MPFQKQWIFLFNQESASALEIERLALTVGGISFIALGVQIVISYYFLVVRKAKRGGFLSICGGVVLSSVSVLVSAFAGLSLAQFAAALCLGLDAFAKTPQRSDQRRKLM